MLAQLKKPYYYSHDCIYWDFSKARWKYFISQNRVHQIDNPDALNEDNENNSLKGNFNDNDQNFYSDILYEVKLGNTIMPSFQIINAENGRKDVKMRYLEVGDQIMFK